MNNRSNMIKMGNHIADLRKQKGYTQKTLGDILDVSDKTVCKWEKGIVAPDITILSSLANTLDVTVEEILAGEEVKKIDAIETIGIYSNMTKKRLIKVFIIFILIFLLSAFFVFRVEEYYSWHLTPLYSEGEISSSGYILSNNKESKILIDRIFFNDNIPNDINEIHISLVNKDEVIYSEEIFIGDGNEVNKAISSYVLQLDYDKTLSVKNINFLIDLYNSTRDVISYKLSFK